MIDIKPGMQRGEIIRELAIAYRGIVLDDFGGRRLSMTEDSELRQKLLSEVEHRLENDPDINSKTAEGMFRAVSYILLNSDEQRRYAERRGVL